MDLCIGEPRADSSSLSHFSLLLLVVAAATSDIHRVTGGCPGDSASFAERVFVPPRSESGERTNGDLPPTVVIDHALFRTHSLRPHNILHDDA